MLLVRIVDGGKARLQIGWGFSYYTFPLFFIWKLILFISRLVSFHWVMWNHGRNDYLLSRGILFDVKAAPDLLEQREWLWKHEPITCARISRLSFANAMRWHQHASVEPSWLVLIWSHFLLCFWVFLLFLFLFRKRGHLLAAKLWPHVRINQWMLIAHIDFLHSRSCCIFLRRRYYWSWFYATGWKDRHRDARHYWLATLLYLFTTFLILFAHSQFCIQILLQSYLMTLIWFDMYLCPLIDNYLLYFSIIFIST